MKAKIKKVNSDGIVRLETSGKIKEILINEEFLYPEEESISICFRGENSSGIIEIKTKEFEEIYKQLEKKLHLIKGFKIIKDS